LKLMAFPVFSWQALVVYKIRFWLAAFLSPF